jgi:hypothetical protein
MLDPRGIADYEPYVRAETSSASPGAKYEATVRPGAALPEEGLFVSCAGGTDIGNALSRALELVQQHPGGLRKADVVLVTDGGSDASAAPALRRAPPRSGSRWSGSASAWSGSGSRRGVTTSTW